MTSSTSTLQHLDRPADRIRLHLQAPGTRALVVEGPTDQHLLETHLPETSIFPVGGRYNVIQTLRVTESADINKCIGVIDPDFEDVPKDLTHVIRPFAVERGGVVSQGARALVG